MKKKRSSHCQIEHVELRRLLSTIFVSSAATGGSNTGTSWTNAYTTLQSALTEATTEASGSNPIVIEVGQGTYKPTTGHSRSTTFQLINSVSIKGGYAGSGTTNPDARNQSLYPTILSGDIGAANVAGDNSYHVVTASGTNSTAVLDGFSITGGNANGNNGLDQLGGGIYSYKSSATIENCTITRNSGGSGAGMSDNQSPLTINNCAIINNSADNIGGGIYNENSSPTLTNCIISGNTGPFGAGFYDDISSPMIVDCTISQNTSNGGSGGGLENVESSSPTLINCLLVGNSVGQNGAAICNVFTSNPTLINCTLTGNTAQNKGGAIYNLQTSAPTITNCILWNDTGTNGFNEIGPNVIANITYTDIDQSGYAGANHNINADPKFIRATGNRGAGDLGDARLQSSSPAIGAGSDTAINGTGVTTDIDGLSRIAGTHVDLGAYESHRGVQSTIFVDPSATGSGNSTDWQDAYPSLAAALDYAVNGDLIEVAQGTYKPSVDENRFDTFSLVTGVIMEGGFAGQINPNVPQNISAYPTILSGDIGTPNDNTDNSYHVVNASNANYTATLNGFTISGGNANGPGNMDGGGIFDNGGGAPISNCIITGNNASFGGGGLYFFSSTTTLTDCTISGNTAGTSGGGIYGRGSTLDLVGCTVSQNKSYSSGGGVLANADTSDTFTTCTITGNSATFDGAGVDNINSPETLSNCTINGNTAGQNGGGVKIDAASPTLTDCTISGNTATNTGGGIYSNSGSAMLTDCILTGNSASAGGAIGDNSSPTHLTNCIVSGNSASNIGGGTIENSSAAVFLNCTFTGNSAVNGGGGIFDDGSNSTLTNCIFWNDSASSYNEILNNSSTSTITFSDVGQSGITGTGDIDVDPLFMRNAGTNGPTDFGDLHLQSHSPAIDIGSNTAITGTTTDADGKPRIVNSTVDLGALEHRLLYVDLHATGSNDGSSWANAFTDLQTALAGASDGTTIDVAQGAYYPTSDLFDTDATFQLADGVSIYGGFAGDTTSTPGARDTKLYPTTLSGNLGDPNLIDDNSNTVVTGSGTNSTALLDGFTISGGNALGSGHRYGGGIHNNNGSPTINDCIITGNRSIVGGGIYNNHHSSPTITNCTISGNNGLANGGGIENFDYSSPTLINCVITGNIAALHGGAIYNVHNSYSTLINCTVADNTAKYGGAISDGTSGGYTITNSIFWGDSPNETDDTRDLGDTSYSDIDQSGFAGSNHNIDADPLFAGTSDFRVTLASPAVDAGLNSAIAGVATDRQGSPRIANGTVDMGAYEILPTIFVDANATGANNGSSWTDALTTLAAALAIAVPGSGQTIDVAQGTYKPTATTDRTISFQLLSNVSVYGGFAGDTTANPGQRDPSLYPTILSGDIGASGNSDNSYHVVSAHDVTASTILDGFTITGGNANGAYPNNRGAGIFAVGSGEQINDCIISGNSAATLGAGLYERTGVGTTVTNCMITGNTGASYGGGGLYASSTNMTVIDSVIAGNTAGRGGGIFNSGSQLTLTNCTISGNAATDIGGGLYDHGATYLNNCILWGDTAQTGGNEVASGSNSRLTITFSDIDQSGFAGSNNDIDADPLFVDPVQHNYRIKVVSPAANAGSNSAIAGTDTDLDGNARINNGTVDMGAYETWPIIYVDASATGTNDGSSFANAFTTLTAALAHATFNSGETIYVAQGTYKPTTGTDRNVSFELIDGVDIDGGFAGDTTANPGQRDVALFTTILSGDIGNAGDNSDNSYHVVYSNGANSTALLDGFTITGGNANHSSHYQNDGGGILNLNGSPTISDCIISGNTATNNGGGIYNDNASPILSDSTVSGNTSSDYGGGIYNQNHSSPILTNCIISGNSSHGSGGGIYNQNHSSPILTNCIISGNSASGNGGGIYNNEYSSPILTNCIISGNSANTNGGGIDNWKSSPTLVNCTISGNTAGLKGAGIYDVDKSATTIVNSIIWADTAGKEIFSNGTSSVTITYSDINPADIMGPASLDSTDINSDPQFARPVGTNGATDFGDLRLQGTSPAINAGSNTAITGTTTDLAGNARIIQGTVDMGAFESTATQLVIAIQPTGSVAAGNHFTFVIDIDDANQDVVNTDNTNVSISLTNGPAGITLGGTLTVAAQNGVADFNNLFMTQPGNYTFTFSDGSLTSAQSAGVTITAGAPASITITRQPADISLGQTEPEIDVKAVDQFGNSVDGSSVVLGIASGPAGAILGGTVSSTVTNGVATFSNITVNEAGTYTLSATDGPAGPVATTSFNVAASGPTGSASKLAFGSTPTSVNAGQTIPAFFVDVEDQNGNVVTSDNSNVTIAIANGPSGATLSGTTTVPAHNGVAQFNDLKLNKAGTYQFSVTDGSLSSAQSASFTIVPSGPVGSATQLVFAGHVLGSGAGQSLSTIEVDVEDANGNIISSDNSTINLTSTPGGIDTSAAAVNGVATFTGLTLTRAGAFTLTAADVSLAAATSNSFTITPSSASSLVIITQPTSQLAGTLAPISVEVEDQYGNPVNGSSVSIAMASGPSGGILGGTHSESVTDGIANFSDLTLNRAGSYTLTVSTPGLAAVTSNSFTISYAGKQLVFSTEPSNSTAGGKLHAFTVETVNPSGTLITTGKSKIALTLSSGGKLIGSANAAVKNGKASFSKLSIQKAGTYTLTASDPTFGSEVSTTFTVSAAAASKLIFNPQPGNASHGTPFNVSVEVTDKYGNAVNDSSTVDLVLGSHPKTASSLNLSTTVGDGLADFDGITLGVAGNYTFKANDGKSKATSKKFVVS